VSDLLRLIRGRKGHGVFLDGEIGGAADARPSSLAKKLSSAPVLLTR
jgi:hypothetical protein